MVWKKYALEMEFTGITRKRAAELIAEHFGTAAQYSFDGDKYSVADTRGRVWTVPPCPSVRAERWQNNKMVGANHLYHMKICTPLLYENDFETVEKILGRLETGGAVTNERTGMAVQLSMAGLDHRERFESNLANLYESRGALLQKAVGREFDSLADCSLLGEQGVVSLPLFPSSLDENDMRSYVQLSQGIVDFATKSKGIRQKENDLSNEKFRMRTWLVRIGFVGEEFKYARKLLTENLSGNSAWLRKGLDVVQPEEMKTAEMQMQGMKAEEIQQEETAETQQEETPEIQQEAQSEIPEVVSFDTDNGAEHLPAPSPADDEPETGEAPQNDITM